MKLYLKLLKQFLRTKSVSTDSASFPEIEKTVSWLQKLFQEHGFKVKVVKGYDNPIIISEKKVDPGLETCLIYGHYDVQPAAEEDGWHQNPFELLIGEERLYGRGVVDNKGQVLVHIASIFELIKAGKLNYNVKFLLEGNEETGSPNLDKFIADKKSLLDADFAMVSDGELKSGRAVIEAGFRGGMNTTLVYKTSDTDLHSGAYGGIVPNAIHELNIFLAKLLDDNYRVKIPGFYLDVDKIDPEIETRNKSIPFSESEFKTVTGVKALKVTDGYDPFTQPGLMPSVQISGIKGGYTDEGYRNAIAGSAKAKINFRLVKSQNPDQIVELFTDFVEKNTPEYVDYDLEISDPYDGVKLNLENKYVKRAAGLLKTIYGDDPVYAFSGGGLPIVTYLQEKLNLKPILVPLGNEDCNMHAVNENFKISDIEKALEFSKIFFSKK